MAQGDGVDRLRDSADLIDLDERRVGNAVIHGLGDDGGIRAEVVVTHQLDLVPELAGQRLPAREIVFSGAVFDGPDRELLHKFVQKCDHLIRAELVFPDAICAILVELGRSGIQSDHDAAAAVRVTSGRNRLNQKLAHLLGRCEVRGEAALIAQPSRVPTRSQNLLERGINLGTRSDCLG